jgi:predicted DNA-binding protein
MYTYIMQRTQISLTDEERRALSAEAARTGKSMSALIRDAVEEHYGAWRSSDDDLVLMRQALGSWADRSEDGATMVERLRSGSRLARRPSDQ